MEETKNIRTGTFLLLVFIITVAFIALIKDFLLVSFWAMVLALIFRNTYRRIRISLYGRSNLAAFLTTFLILLVVVIPVSLISLAVVGESAELYQKYQEGDIDPEQAVELLEDQLPRVERFLRQFGVSSVEIERRFRTLVVNITQFFAGQAMAFTQNTINFAIQFFLMLYLLFFFLRDGRAIVRKVINMLPLGNKREWLLFQQVAIVSRATLKGTVIVAITQGSIGGILFWAVGIEAPVLWGVLMTFLSLLPVGGSAIIWVPAAIIMFIQEAYTEAIVIVLVGSLLIGLVDNLLRPLLVSRDTKMSDYLVLLTTLGGLAWFGLSGFIVGPVIAAIFMTCWEMMGREFGGRAR